MCAQLIDEIADKGSFSATRRGYDERIIYIITHNIVNGFITLPKGVRVGLSGTIVTEGDKVITVKDFQAVNIRIPHIVKNCSLQAYDYIVGDGINNTLVISAPGSGKTTFIRDFIYQLSAHNISKNVLVADERNEICSVVNGEPNVDLH